MAAILKKLPVLAELAKPKLNVFLKYAKVKEVQLVVVVDNQRNTVHLT